MPKQNRHPSQSYYSAKVVLVTACVGCSSLFFLGNNSANSEKNRPALDGPVAVVQFKTWGSKQSRHRLSSPLQCLNLTGAASPGNSIQFLACHSDE